MCYLKDEEPENTFVELGLCPNAKALDITEAVNIATSNVCDNWKGKEVALVTDGEAVMRYSSPDQGTPIRAGLCRHC